MQKATATYIAPPGDSKVVEMCGVTFHDGKAVELNSDDHQHLINKLPGNQHFEVEMGEKDDTPKPKRGRPSNADIKANMAAATAHDFEKDRQDEIARRDALS